MKFTKQVLETPGFQMTSMMDVVFLMLTFFVTISIFSQWETEIDIQLPTAETGVIPDRLPGEVIVNINKEGDISINQVVLTQEELLEKFARLVELFPGHPIVIRSDQGTEYKHVVAVLDTCGKAGISNISFATARIDESDAKERNGADELPAAAIGSIP